MNESNEWGQVYILECISQYDASDSKECENCIERVLPRLSHANPAVALGAVKVVLKFMDYVSNADAMRNYNKKVAAALVTLLSAEPEIQYIALRNVNFILQKKSTIFEKNVKVFFCKYNDPIYVKTEKIDILVKVAEASNVDVILGELKEYSNDIDQELVRQSVKAIGHVAIKVDRAAKKSIEVISGILQ